MTTENVYEIKKQEIQPITTITLEDKPYEVADMSDEIKRAVAIFNRWNEKEVDAQYELELLSDNLTMIRAAKENLSQQIFNMMKKESDEKAAEAANDEAEEAKEEGAGPNGSGE